MGVVHYVVEFLPPEVVVEVINRLVGVELDVHRVAAGVSGGRPVQVERIELEAVLVVGTGRGMLLPLKRPLVRRGLPVDVSAKAERVLPSSQAHVVGRLRPRLV